MLKGLKARLPGKDVGYKAGAMVIKRTFRRYSKKFKRTKNYPFIMEALDNMCRLIDDRENPKQKEEYEYWSGQFKFYTDTAKDNLPELHELREQQKKTSEKIGGKMEEHLKKNPKIKQEVEERLRCLKNTEKEKKEEA